MMHLVDTLAAWETGTVELNKSIKTVSNKKFIPRKKGRVLTRVLTVTVPMWTCRKLFLTL